MQIYNYDRESGEYLDACEADPDPMTPGAYLIPAHATAIAPPEVRALQAAVFDPESQSWRSVDVSYRLADAQLRELSRRLAEVGPLFDAFSDLGALDELDADGLEYLQALRLYRVQLRMVPQQPGFPANPEWPAAPALRQVPRDPLRPGRGE